MNRNLRLITLAWIGICLFPPSLSARDSGKIDPMELAEIKRIQEANGKTLADSVQQINALQQEIQALKGTLEENRHFIEEAGQNNEKVLKDFDMRLTAMEEKLGLFESQIQEMGGKPIAPIKTGTTTNIASDEENTAYRKALAEINAQNYKGAIPLLDQFLKKYPKSAMADNAQYWKGESLYGLKRFPEAILEFQKVVKRFPKSDKVPAAVLKQGFCFFEAKEYLDAKAFLEKVAKDFPKSEEAIKAKDKIKQIDQLLAKGGGKKPISAQPR